MAKDTKLRDGAAVAAMQGLISNGSTNVEGTATSALAYADALCKAIEAADKPVEPPVDPEGPDAEGKHRPTQLPADRPGRPGAHPDNTLPTPPRPEPKRG